MKPKFDIGMLVELTRDADCGKDFWFWLAWRDQSGLWVPTGDGGMVKASLGDALLVVDNVQHSDGTGFRCVLLHGEQTFLLNEDGLQALEFETKE